MRGSQVEVPGIAFSLTGQLAWPAEASPQGSDLFYEVAQGVTALKTGSTAIVDEDGNLITSLDSTGLRVPSAGTKTVKVRLGWGEAPPRPHCRVDWVCRGRRADAATSFVCQLPRLSGG